MSDRIDWGIALVVGGKASFSQDVLDALATRFDTVVRASSFESAFARLSLREPLALVLVDVDSMEGAVFVAVEAARVAPTPVVFAVYTQNPTPEDAFLLGRSGVHQMLAGPLTAERLLAELEVLDTVELPPLPTVVSRYVGRMKMVEFLDNVRLAFIDDAIERAKENRSAAARLLGVHRQIVQRRLNDRAH